VSEHLNVRLVPISADQIRVLESLQRASFRLAADVNRDLGIDGDSIARLGRRISPRALRSLPPLKDG
jgi:hypothetical protein